MNIRKAIIKAHKNQKGITRMEWMPRFEPIVFPTNTSGCCLLIPYESKKEIGKRWNPTYDDLVATDWIVI